MNKIDLNVLEYYPIRGPLDIVKNIKDLIIGKQVCDLGCGKGDLLALMSQYASSVCGIEQNKTDAIIALNRGLQIYNEDLYKMIPMADVYYLWVSNQVDMIEYLIKSINYKCTLLVGSRKGFSSMEDIVKKYKGTSRSFQYKENTPDNIISRYQVKNMGHFKNEDVWLIGIISVH